jgi:hypothetical protein
MGSTYDVFLVLHPFRENVSEFRILVRPLSDLGRKHMVGAEGFYDQHLDTALLVLRFPEELVQHWGEKIINTFARRTGLPMVIPSELSPTQRRQFFLEHVSSYDTYVQQYWDANDPTPLAVRVLEHLEQHVADMRAPSRSQFFDARAMLPVHGGGRRHRLGSVGA